MLVQIRKATKKEHPGLFRPFVCVGENQVYFRFEPWSLSLASTLDGTVIKGQDGAIHTYALPDGRVFTAEPGSPGWRLNGLQPIERWPTLRRREWVIGPHTVRIRPEDDELSFDTGDGPPSVEAALIGFYLALPTPD